MKKYKFTKMLGSGKYGDVWEATDLNLNRQVAIKFIRFEHQGDLDALAHAKSLVQAAGLNVVAVYSFERLWDPKAEAEHDAIVMEHIDGVSFEKTYSWKSSISQQEAYEYGYQLIGAVKHIHSCGIPHGDLHNENVLIDLNHNKIKIIDILLLKNFEQLSTMPKDDKFQKDILDVKNLITLLVSESFGSDYYLTFNKKIQENNLLTLEVLETAFVDTLSGKFDNSSTKTNTSTTVDSEIYSEFIKPKYIKSARYANALIESYGINQCINMLIHIAQNKLNISEYRLLINTIKSHNYDFHNHIQTIETHINNNLEDHNSLYHHVNLAAYLDWSTLRSTTRTRIEDLIYNDIKMGAYTVKTKKVNPGLLGLLVRLHWRVMDSEQIFNAICYSLQQSDYARVNYSSKYFFKILYSIALEINKTTKAKEIIRSLKDSKAVNVKKHKADLHSVLASILV